MATNFSNQAWFLLHHRGGISPAPPVEYDYYVDRLQNPYTDRSGNYYVARPTPPLKPLYTDRSGDFYTDRNRNVYYTR